VPYAQMAAHPAQLPTLTMFSWSLFSRQISTVSTQRIFLWKINLQYQSSSLMVGEGKKKTFYYDSQS
jgi:hypothetical protein